MTAYYDLEASPLYQRIAQWLQAQIAAGVLKAGDRVPSERKIAEALGASRMTARQALKFLERRGLVETRVGRGAFVAEPRIERQVTTAAGFSEAMARAGRKVSSIVLDAAVGAAHGEAAAALSLTTGTPIHRLVRLRLVDGAPVAVERAEVPVALAPDLLARADFAAASLAQVLREVYGFRPAEAEETVQAAACDSANATLLSCAVGAPVLKLTRLTFDAGGRPLDYVRSVYRGDVLTMRARLNLAKDP